MKPLESLHHRLQTLELELGIIQTESPPADLDDVLARLERLEKIAAGKASGTAPLPDKAGTELEWQAWDNNAAELQESTPAFQSVEDQGVLSRYGSSMGLDITGWVMLSYFFDEKRDLSTFNANVVELDIQKRLSEDFLIRSDLDYINEGLDPVFPAFRHPAYAMGGSNSGSLYSGGAIGYDDDDDFELEQLYLEWTINDELTLKSGRFNTPVGLEAVDPWDWYSILPSIIFPLQARSLTGLMLTYQINERWTISPYITNGYLDENNNDAFSYSLHSRYRILDDLTLEGAITYGPPFPDNTKDDLVQFDLLAAYTGIRNTLFALEYFYSAADTDSVPGFQSLGDVTYYGVLGVASYDFNRYLRLALQSGYVWDNDGFVWGAPQERWEISVIPSIFLTDTIEIRFQYQHVEANDPLLRLQHKNASKSIFSKTDDIFSAAAYIAF